MSNLSEGDLKVLGSRIKDERGRREMNRGVFAEHVEVSVGLLMSMEHGTIDLTCPDCLKVLRELGLYTEVKGLKVLPPTKRRRWKRFKLHSNFTSRTRKLPPRHVRESLHR